MISDRMKAETTHSVDEIAKDISRPSPILVGNGHPEEVAHALHEGRGGEEVGYLGNRGSKQARVLSGMGTREELHGGGDHGNAWSGGEEVAHAHGETDDCCLVGMLVLAHPLGCQWPRGYSPLAM